MNIRTIYWVSTLLFVAFMLFSAFSYLTMAEMKGAFVHLGFPDYFRIELAAAKFIGALVLALPFLPRDLKMFAYAGFAINIFSGAVAHLSVGDGVSSLGLIVFSAILWTVSFVTFQKDALGKGR